MQIGKYNIFRVVDQPTFNLDKVVEEYETLLEKHFYFAIDHPLIYIEKFDDFDNFANKHLNRLKNSAALYVSKFLTKTNSGIIYLRSNLNEKTCKNPIQCLAHELGHHTFQTLELNSKFEKYVLKNTKSISFKNFVKNVKKKKLQGNIKIQNLYTKILNDIIKIDKGVDFMESFNSGIANSEIIAKILQDLPPKDQFINNNYDVFTKHESTYWINNEEIFCEIFAAYMTDTLTFKSNKKFINKIITEDVIPYIFENFKDIENEIPSIIKKLNEMKKYGTQDL